MSLKMKPFVARYVVLISIAITELDDETLEH